ncbi:MAG TPA: hypothetical protein DCK83_13645 [Gallionellaceae bacterium]|nr:hypothetical protein [Gallionellaceae bacterium]
MAKTLNDGEDIVRHLLRLISVQASVITPEELAALELIIRRDWGGKRPYIAKRSLMLRRARENVLATIGTKPDMQVARDHGICRSTMYLWLRKGRGDEK